MRLGALVLGCLVAATACAQNAWEKPIAPGLVYRQEVNAAIPRIVHALRFSLRSPAVKAVPELASGKTMTSDTMKGRATVTDMVKANAALGGINGDFFPWTGDPLGLMVREGKLISEASNLRASMGWGPDDAAATIARFEGVVANDAGLKLKLDGVNRQVGPNEVVLNTPLVGVSVAAEPTLIAVLRPETPSLAPSTIVEATVDYLLPDTSKTEVKPGVWYLVGCGNKVEEIAKLRKGQTLRISVKTQGFDWSKVESVVGGGPILVKDGKVAVDGDAEGFKADFTAKRHPRTAVGVTSDGDMWFVVVDGRQETSDGMTLDELATLMAGLGCRDAVNLDGGGSSAMNLFGATMNRPSDGKERPVANGVVFYGPAPLATSEPLTIKVGRDLTIGSTVDASVVDSKGNEIDNADVLWGAFGAAWVDQGGTMHPIKPGKATLVATIGKKQVTLELTVKPKPAKDTNSSATEPGMEEPKPTPRKTTKTVKKGSKTKKKPVKVG